MKPPKPETPELWWCIVDPSGEWLPWSVRRFESVSWEAVCHRRSFGYPEDAQKAGYRAEKIEVRRAR